MGHLWRKNLAASKDEWNIPADYMKANMHANGTIVNSKG